MNSKLKIWRKQKKLKQKDVAEKLGVNPSYISLIEKGLRTPSAKTILLIEDLTQGFVTLRDFDLSNAA